MVRSTITVGVVAALAVGAAVAPSTADAKPKPKRAAVATGSAAGILPDAATVRGAVRANGVATTFSFQYGTTRRYDATTPEFDGGDSSKLRSVKAALLNLAPATTYHYRIVARNARGVVRGKDRTFKTRKQPLGLLLVASANPAPAEQPITLSGQLTGTDQDNRRLTLQSKPFPYIADWARVPGVNDVVTTPGAAGAFSFALGSVPFNTQFRVAVTGKSDVVSPIVAVGVAPRVSTTVPSQVKRRRSGKARITWRGTITPTRDGSQVLVQKRVKGQWRTIGVTTATGGSDTQSRYRKTVRQRRGGTYRVVVNPVDGAFVPSSGPEKRIRVKRR